MGKAASTPPAVDRLVEALRSDLGEMGRRIEEALPHRTATVLQDQIQALTAEIAKLKAPPRRDRDDTAHRFRRNSCRPQGSGCRSGGGDGGARRAVVKLNAWQRGDEMLAVCARYAISWPDARTTDGDEDRSALAMVAPLGADEVRAAGRYANDTHDGARRRSRSSCMHHRPGGRGASSADACRSDSQGVRARSRRVRRGPQGRRAARRRLLDPGTVPGAQLPDRRTACPGPSRRHRRCAAPRTSPDWAKRYATRCRPRPSQRWKKKSASLGERIEANRGAWPTSPALAELESESRGSARARLRASYAVRGNDAALDRVDPAADAQGGSPSRSRTRRPKFSTSSNRGSWRCTRWRLRLLRRRHYRRSVARHPGAFRQNRPQPVPLRSGRA